MSSSMFWRTIISQSRRTTRYERRWTHGMKVHGWCQERTGKLKEEHSLVHLPLDQLERPQFRPRIPKPLKHPSTPVISRPADRSRSQTLHFDHLHPPPGDHLSALLVQRWGDHDDQRVLASDSLEAGVEDDEALEVLRFSYQRRPACVHRSRGMGSGRVGRGGRRDRGGRVVHGGRRGGDFSVGRARPGGRNGIGHDCLVAICIMM
jgi:hypothetical protein